MNAKRISNLFQKLGISPRYKGYPYLVHLVNLAINYYGQSFPNIKELYQQTAKHFDIPLGMVTDNIRTLLRNYWNQKNAAIFSSIIGYPVPDRLSTKEFVAVIAEYLAVNNLFGLGSV